MPVSRSRRSSPASCWILPAARNMAAFAKAVRKRKKMAPSHAFFATAGARRQREQQEQIAKLRDRRIGDQRLQPIRPESLDRTPENGAGPQHTEELGCQAAEPPSGKTSNHRRRVR